MIAHPWVFFGFLLIMLLLQLGATLRVRHDKNLKRRAQLDRRLAVRGGAERRWRARPPKHPAPAK